MFKDISIKILIALGCMMVGTAVHHFIEYDLVYFVAGSVYMAIAIKTHGTNITEDEEDVK